MNVGNLCQPNQRMSNVMCELRYPWCPTCKNNFPMREDMYEDLEDSGHIFYCNKGHSITIPRTSITSQMRNAVRRSEYKSQYIGKLEKHIQSLRGVLARYRNRLLKGVCPYCGESAFIKDLVGHINDHHKSKNR